MPLSEGTIEAAWRLARGRYECTREAHRHDGRCGRELQRELKGFFGEGGWFAREWTPLDGGRDEPANVEILCATCYEAAEPAAT